MRQYNDFRNNPGKNIAPIPFNLKRFGLVLVLIHVMLLFSCNDDAAGGNLDVQNLPATDSTYLLPDTAAGISGTTELYIWSIDSENRSRTKNPHVKPAYLNVDTIIKGLNIIYPGVKLESRGLRHDTIFAVVGDSDYLTEQMGSSGASDYLACAVINLTSISGIRYVRIDFEEGSHAAPDTWTADMFNDYKEIP